MDVIALFVAALAAFVFLVETIAQKSTPPRTFPWLVPLGLFLLTVALICQFTHVAGPGNTV